MNRRIRRMNAVEWAASGLVILLLLIVWGLVHSIKVVTK